MIYLGDPSEQDTFKQYKFNLNVDVINPRKLTKSLLMMLKVKLFSIFFGVICTKDQAE